MLLLTASLRYHPPQGRHDAGKRCRPRRGSVDLNFSAPSTRPKVWAGSLKIGPLVSHALPILCSTTAPAVWRAGSRLLALALSAARPDYSPGACSSGARRRHKSQALPQGHPRRMLKIAKNRSRPSEKGGRGKVRRFSSAPSLRRSPSPSAARGRGRRAGGCRR